LYPSGSGSPVGALAAWLFVAACASSRPADAVPQDVGQVVANAAACPVTAAWAAGAAAAIPRVIRCVLPRYPDDLRHGGVEGKVVIRVAVDSAGVPDSTSLQVVSATTAGLAAAASRSVPHLRFAPARAGEPRPVVVEMPYTFAVTP
jgi:TonB family protein